VGRKNIQLMGFLVMGTLFCVCGYGHEWFLGSGGADSDTDYRQWLFLFLYSLTFLFSNFGPNTTTFVIPGEIYPANVRATAHGLSAASGKLGAAAGAYFFPMMLGPGGSANPTPEGLRAAMITCGFVAWLGAVFTYWFTPRYGADELEDEDNYHPLEHSCLQPPPEEFKTLLSSNSQYEMVMIVDSISSHNLESVVDEVGGLVI
jgi:PHS family inorganic phosphate transporter-like MFS transporter